VLEEGTGDAAVVAALATAIEGLEDERRAAGLRLIAALEELLKE
jgi:hypothetical protein